MLCIEDMNKLKEVQLIYDKDSPQYNFFESIFKYRCYWLGRTDVKGIDFEKQMIEKLNDLNIKYNIIPNFKLEI